MIRVVLITLFTAFASPSHAQGGVGKGAATVIKKVLVRPQVATALGRQMSQQGDDDSSSGANRQIDPQMARLLNRAEDCQRPGNMSATCNWLKLQPTKPPAVQQEPKSKPRTLEKIEYSAIQLKNTVAESVDELAAREKLRSPLSVELDFEPLSIRRDITQQSQGIHPPHTSESLREIGEGNVNQVLPSGWDGKRRDIGGAASK